LQSDAAKSVMLVDGMALLFRGYFANSYGGFIRKTKSGIPTNAVYGFVKYLIDACKTFNPTHIACCWDLSSQTFRTEQFADYKRNRPEAPPELIPQFDLVKQVVSGLSIPNISSPGFEADDCIGTLSRQLSAHMEVLVLTGDHDMLQLVDERVKVIIMKKGPSNYAVYDGEKLLEERQLTAKQFIDLKGLIGDTSDNYPGVKGIGEKTATKLLVEYASIEGILENLHLLPKGVKAKIEADIDMLHLCRQLATIHLEAPVVCTPDECVWQPDFAKIVSLFEELEFNSLVKDARAIISAVS